LLHFVLLGVFRSRAESLMRFEAIGFPIAVAVASPFPVEKAAGEILLPRRFSASSTHRLPHPRQENGGLSSLKTQADEKNLEWETVRFRLLFGIWRSEFGIRIW